MKNFFGRGDASKFRKPATIVLLLNYQSLSNFSYFATSVSRFPKLYQNTLKRELQTVPFQRIKIIFFCSTNLPGCSAELPVAEIR